MDTQKTGLFISLLRKQKGLTQAELAARIGVTDKAVSRWETGKGFPDISLLPPLAQALGTSVTELLAGEPMSVEERAEHSGQRRSGGLRYAGRMGRKTAAVLLAVAGCFLLLTPLFMAGRTWGLRLAGLALLALAAAARYVKLPRPDLGRLLSPGAARVETVLCLLAALCPGADTLWRGAELRPPGGGRHHRHLPGNLLLFQPHPLRIRQLFSPLMTGALTVVLLPLSLVQLLRPRPKLGNALFLLDVLAAALSAASWVVFGRAYVSGVGVGITVCLVLAAAALALANRRKISEKNPANSVDFPENT